MGIDLNSGPWRGFWTYGGESTRHPTSLHLDFADDLITGHGDDEVGRFSIEGERDAADGRCAWTKRYVGKHPVEYWGEAGPDGIAGIWRIPGSGSGAFALWTGESGEAPSGLLDRLPKVRGISLRLKLALMVLLVLLSAAVSIYLQLRLKK